ncbi:MAG: hypothetical protein CRN43_04940 [Candidatus Nephrothrix sp. EaCA]|nr:MAG: hypothetical protein CRN43_04940 [Candidatus Nephrothrix sp. EaCA]
MNNTIFLTQVLYFYAFGRRKIVRHGAVKKFGLTDSVASVESDGALRINPMLVEQGLQGKIAGGQASQNEGRRAHALIHRQAKGTNTFFASEPLYVIDGIPFLNNNSATLRYSVLRERHGRNLSL